ncbi:MAG: winged helix-turn-helix transcriptional regulator [Deltaproteobacteria bacterium]|nr:winged helix-turn-helix transcriptional regulator [Deltaproteobacteria bacterium]
MEKELFKLQSDVCKTMANPKRLEIIYTLKDGERSVSEIVSATTLAPANVSQHLAVLRSSGVVKMRRLGTSIFYKIANPKIIKACALMRQVLLDEMKEKEKLLKRLK